MSELRDKQVLILGLGETGLACARWCAGVGARVRVADTRESPPALAALMALMASSRRIAIRNGEESVFCSTALLRSCSISADFCVSPFDDRFDAALLDGVDLLIVSPGLPGDLAILRAAAARGIEIVGEIELFARALHTLPNPAPVLAITGTNGKTTTTALTGHLLRAAGLHVGVAGNISPAALSALTDAVEQQCLPDAWVLELSSFQLETVTTLNPAAATVLNISDDHLDRYADLAAYAAAKARIFQGDGAQVLNRQDAYVMAMALPGRRVASFGLDAPPNANDFGLRPHDGAPWLAQGERLLLPQAELSISGLHNAANALAALALCAALGHDPVALLPALRAFRGLPHRVEKIAEIDGVIWYDDSKGTNVGATVAALDGLGGGLGAGLAAALPADMERKDSPRIVLIAGGDGKGQDFSPLRAAVARHARAVVLLGRDAPLIRAAIEATAAITATTAVAAADVPLVDASDMADAVRQARALARPGDAVLLSPACASFDMFRDYQQRAEAFVAAVRALPETTP